MSFKLTAPQIRQRSKTVTRRLGWGFLQAGDVIQAVVQSQGLKKGQSIEPLAVIRITDVRREPLVRLCDDHAYGRSETTLEGFEEGPYSDPTQFVEWFASTHGCGIEDEVTRIAFEYVESGHRQ